ncbi:50S ribosomal protein L35 [Rhodospirillum rubrum]|uniref:Large ribosomal subunit protein bL35 n=1 Tax=Rhodospirillum rubrum (strain ATCC 11170 / ATH 1.1.1 / DSM 467 / LMG 4362 / NCIMB 8255 / S1) TaxID=269796 RepID=RL35_RHORT|nr:50S ribosomal protein L35 [Rhodospirillum rubrum]Q2RNI0.1 RecName: Full=Large ribosomal subunit protein bL35; AltName: Full=50S ribosomal protein L35 [Rhodospirillum rubrum ATCC 11170]ABC24315.1 LSU ribosomal protein L35P [Rhodospirillum rubrum ATCC 11170]AEO50066.1 50S ribosomal protein L35P [Rhodospirillum rubrum F11]MBK1663068.1 50S ribosomal protein L35 [Rhodospirillum rubrum]MBK1675777.1 50S ribosomal protein L35 [Rhodospirillum rubrum]MBK5956034.1 50S ribosomal protein L35 [Rhodospir
MPKLKTKSAVKKRFSLTGTGKIKVKVAYKSHLLSNKGTKMKRQARGTFILCDADQRIVKKFMPYG